MKERYDILTELINKFNFKNIAEVGCARGLCAKEILKNCKLEKYYLIDNDMFSIVDYNDTFREHPHAKFIRLPSNQAVKCIEDKELDLVFIDANHSYDNAKEDITLWLPKVRSGGILCGHDYFPNDKTYGVTIAVNEIFGSDIILERDNVPNEELYIWEKFIK